MSPQARKPSPSPRSGSTAGPQPGLHARAVTTRASHRDHAELRLRRHRRHGLPERRRCACSAGDLERHDDHAQPGHCLASGASAQLMVANASGVKSPIGVTLTHGGSGGVRGSNQVTPTPAAAYDHHPGGHRCGCQRRPHPGGRGRMGREPDPLQAAAPARLRRRHDHQRQPAAVRAAGRLASPR